MFAQHAIILLVSLVLVVVSAGVMVRAAVRVASVLSISTYVIGFTLVAFGTSFPELVISSVSALKGTGDIALGNVTGSNIANIGAALSLAMIIGGPALVFGRKLLKIEIPVLIGLQLLLFWYVTSFAITRLEAASLFVLVTAAIVWLIFARRQKDLIPEDEYKAAQAPNLRGGARTAYLIKQLVVFIVFCVVMYVSADMCVTQAVIVSQLLGVSERLIGLTVIAVGTTLPEIVTCVMASIQGHHRVSVGTILGSNMINIGIVLGVSGMLRPLALASGRAHWADLVVAIIFCVILAPVVLLNGRVWTRALGFVLCALYVLYVILITQVWPNTLF